MPEFFRVLQIEDSESDAALVLRMLEKAGHKVFAHRVEDADQMRDALSKGPWDVIIADYRLPQFDAPAALRVLRESGRDIPFLVVSGAIGEEAAVAMMKAGAQDYLMKDKLARLAPAVEREVAEARARRDHKAIEQRLRDAQRAESIGVLAGGIAHQFNNILTAVSGHLSLALTDLCEECHIRGNLITSLASVERAAGLTKQLLAYAGKGAFVRQSVNISEAAEQAARMVRGALPPNIKLRLELATGLPDIHIDPAQIQLVLANLLQNSVEAIGPEGGVVTIRTSGKGDSPKLEVVDTGQGMDAETLKRVFDPFFSTKFTGRGLGMAAVYGIVKAMKGEIAIQSAPGEGTCVEVSFPPAIERTLMPSAAAPQSGKVTGAVLVVDDEESIRKLAAAILSKNGIPVFEACSGRQAIAQIATHGADIRAVLLDMAMPDMHGHEALPAMRHLQPNLRFVVSSGYSELEVRRRFQSLDVDAFLAKPYTGAQLLSVMSSALASADDGR